MQKLLAAIFAFASLAYFGSTAFAKTSNLGAISPKDLRSDCDVLGGKFGEVTDKKTGTHYYWCKTGTTITKCTDKTCTITYRAGISAATAAAAAGSARNPGLMAGATPAVGASKAGAVTSGTNSKGPTKPVVGASSTASNAGVAKPVTVPGPVSNNNKRQQQ